MAQRVSEKSIKMVATENEQRIMETVALCSHQSSPGLACPGGKQGELSCRAATKKSIRQADLHTLKLRKA